MIHELPRGPFDSYLRAHYFTDKPGVLPRFSMGCGAIFMIQRVRALDASPISPGAITETDPRLLAEMIALVVAQGLEAVSLTEMRRRLIDGDLGRRFVCFTLDGAYRSVIDHVFPLFKARNIPFTLYAATDYLDSGQVPWWLALEALLVGCKRIVLELDGATENIRCGSETEKQQVYLRLYHRLRAETPQARVELLGAALRKHGLDPDALAAQEMLSGGELRMLAAHRLVTLGTQGGGLNTLAGLSFDEAREDIKASCDALEAVTGERPRHLAIPGGGTMALPPRDVEIARELGFETAVTAIEGALWPEHGRELLALPRIALNNDPATLVRVLMLSGAGHDKGTSAALQRPRASSRRWPAKVGQITTALEGG